MGGAAGLNHRCYVSGKCEFFPDNLLVMSIERGLLR